MRERHLIHWQWERLEIWRPIFLLVNMNEHQLVQWLSVQASDMAAILQHVARTWSQVPAVLRLYRKDMLMNLLACVHNYISSAETVWRWDRCSRIKFFATDPCQHKWHARQKAQNFVQHTRLPSENFVRRDLAVVECFESNKEYDPQMNQKMLAFGSFYQ